MPSSPGYKRDYAQERKTAIKRGETLGSDSDNAKRKKLRRAFEKKGLVHEGDGKDVDHKHALSKGGSNNVKNGRVVAAATNRSFPRNADGSMKENHPKGGTRRNK